jgi:hypothetical protein
MAHILPPFGRTGEIRVRTFSESVTIALIAPERSGVLALGRHTEAR